MKNHGINGNRKYAQLMSTNQGLIQTARLNEYNKRKKIIFLFLWSWFSINCYGKVRNNHPSYCALDAHQLTL